MAGHSKWANIKHRKGAQDAKRSKIFQKITKEITVAVKAGGPDASSNPSLRLILDKARAANMPKDNIERAITKASGGAGGDNYDEIRYEGYGPSGIAIMVDCLSDNRNRTAANVRAAFNKRGGNLGENGSVSYLFDRKGVLVIDRQEYPNIDEDTIMMAALESGADDVETSEEAYVITTNPSDFEAVKAEVNGLGVENFATAEISMVPQSEIEVDDATREKVEALIEMLEDDDDVNDVYHNMA